MFRQFSNEETIQKYAEEVLRTSKSLSLGLTESLIKVAKEEAMSPTMIENVCHKVNHRKFQEEFAIDKLASFQRANFTDAINAIYKVGADTGEGESKSVFIKAASFKRDWDYSEETHIVKVANEEEDRKFALEQKRDIIQETTTRQGMLLNKLAYETFEKGKDLEGNIERLLSKNRNELSKVASHLHSVLSPVIGEELSLSIIDKIASVDVDAQGYEITKTASEDIYHKDMDKIEDIVKRAQELVDLSIIRGFGEANFYELAGMYKEAGASTNDMFAIWNSAPGDFLFNEALGESMIKNAGLAQTLGRLFKREGPELVTKSVKNLSPEVKKQMSNVVKGALTSAMAIPPAFAMGAAINYTDDLILDSKKKKVFKELLTRFPELKEIPPKEFYDRFESIVGLTPTLLKAPYALSQVIYNGYKYGVMDNNTTFSLMSANKRKAPVNLQIGADTILKGINESTPSRRKELETALLQKKIDELNMKTSPDAQKALKNQQRLTKMRLFLDPLQAATNTANAVVGGMTGVRGNAIKAQANVINAARNGVRNAHNNRVAGANRNRHNNQQTII